MTDLAKPKLRAVQAIPYDSEGERVVCLRDSAGYSGKTVVMPMRAFYVISLMDGAHTLPQILEEYAARFGESLTLGKIEEMVRQLDDALMLEGPRFEARLRVVAEEYARATVRKAAFAGHSYPPRPPAIEQAMRGFFAAPEGPGPVDPRAEGAQVLAIAAPHADPRRGGPMYAHAYKALAEGSAAETFVVLGVAHEPMQELFVATEKSFETPLGIVPCDRGFTGDLIRRAGLKRGEAELVHRSEHSIEFQALFLRHLFGRVRPARIVPVLCGSLMDYVPAGADPMSVEPVARFVEALRALLREYGEQAAVIASVDLAHVGQRFGDSMELTPKELGRIESEDLALLRRAEKMDAAGFFNENRAGGDRRRICGFAALYALLGAVPATRGRLLRYEQSVEEETRSVVTYVAMTFER